MKIAASRNVKHAAVFRALRDGIATGRWPAGARLPSEADLTERFGVSRITVGRAVQDLQRAGLVDRKVGSGTFVKAGGSGCLSFGLLIPDLGRTEIFEPICQGIMNSPAARQHALLWGNAGQEPVAERAAIRLCRQYIERRVGGVFFAPLEAAATAEPINREILGDLDAAGIPVVLLDRSSLPYPQAPRHDLVGIDNRRAGYVMTQHLLSQGCARIGFAASRTAAATVDGRAAGYREALFAADAPFDRCFAYRGAPDDVEGVAAFMREVRPDGMVCANDHTAGALMHALKKIGRRVPEDVRLVGLDDVEYARLLPTPLTTLRQPTRQIGEAALHAMLQRVARRDLPPREIRLPCELIVRDSCGAGMALAR